MERGTPFERLLRLFRSEPRLFLNLLGKQNRPAVTHTANVSHTGLVLRAPDVIIAGPRVVYDRKGAQMQFYRGMDHATHRKLQKGRERRNRGRWAQ